MKERYSRGQIDQVLLKYFSSGTISGRSPGIPETIIKVRTKRLLEIDKQEAEINKLPRIFTTKASAGQKFKKVFSAHNCFSLGLAHELLDAGFKQGEVVFMLQHLKDVLAKSFKILNRYPEVLAFRQCVLGEEYPFIPNLMDKPRFIDMCSFFVFEKMDRPLKERPDRPIFINPCVCFGQKSLIDKVNRNCLSGLKLTVVEMTHMVLHLKEQLQQIPEIKLGRPKTSESKKS